MALFYFTHIFCIHRGSQSFFLVEIFNDTHAAFFLHLIDIRHGLFELNEMFIALHSPEIAFNLQ